MARLALLLTATALSACVGHLPEDKGVPPVVRISHEGEVVSHSSPKEREARSYECADGRVRGGDVFAVGGGFPATFEAEFVDRFGLRQAEVTVFGGTITDTPKSWSVASTVVDGQYAEVASRRFDRFGLGLGIKEVRFGALPVAGSRGGQSTIKLAASAEDRKGRIARTTTPLLASPSVLCGSL